MQVIVTAMYNISNKTSSTIHNEIFPPRATPNDLRTETANRGVLLKKVFLENSQENTCARVSFFNNVADLRCNPASFEILKFHSDCSGTETLSPLGLKICSLLQLFHLT